MLNGGSMVWGFCVYFVYMIPLETDVLRKHRFQKYQCWSNRFIILCKKDTRKSKNVCNGQLHKKYMFYFF